MLLALLELMTLPTRFSVRNSHQQGLPQVI
jgi:hypothetical protein